MDTATADFDTDFHEAIALFPTEEEEKKNKIIDANGLSDERQGFAPREGGGRPIILTRRTFVDQSLSNYGRSRLLRNTGCRQERKRC